MAGAVGEHPPGTGCSPHPRRHRPYQQVAGGTPGEVWRLGIIIQKFCSAHTYPPCWVLKARIQKYWGKLFHDKCPGFFYVHYTTHGTYSFMSHPKDEAIMIKCLAQIHKRRDQLGRDSNPHSDNTRTWVQCTRLLHKEELEKGASQNFLSFSIWSFPLLGDTMCLQCIPKRRFCGPILNSSCS